MSTDFLQKGKTALYLAAEFAHESVVKVLLDKGANVDVADEVLNIHKNVKCSIEFAELALILCMVPYRSGSPYFIVQPKRVSWILCSF